jgi:hypothetical protein
MLPQSETVYTGTLVPNAPPDMFCALGKYDQKIYIVPSSNLVVVRMGSAADSTTDALSVFDNALWGYIDSLTCSAAPLAVNNLPAAQPIGIYPNPVTNMVYLQAGESGLYRKIYMYNVLGKLVAQYTFTTKLDLSALAAGIYVLRVTDVDGNTVATFKIVRQ